MDCDTDYEPPKSRLRTPLYLPRDFLCNLRLFAERRSLSHEGLVEICGEVVRLGGGDVSDYSLSYGTSVRYGNQQRSLNVSKIDDATTYPPFLNLHQDGGKVQDCGSVAEEHVAAIVTGPDNFSKLLGMLPLENGKACNVTEFVMDRIEEKKVLEHSKIIVQCCDSTSVNTGVHDGKMSY
jgi:hypothetical protein